MLHTAPVTAQPADTATAEDLTTAIQGANPFVGMTPRQVVSAGVRWAGALAKRPTLVASGLLTWAGEEAKILGGLSEVAPEPKDRRFTDPAWQSPVWRRVCQSYVLTRKGLLSSIDELDLDQKSADRARFALMQVTEAAAPTNNLLSNPVALRTALETRGSSLADGARHLLHDLRFNGGMPSQVDTRPFRVGETIATTPGSVVHRTPMFELIQYRPATPQVATIPTVIIPPQINRYYFLDLAPQRSFVEFAISRGIQMFLISWRNPGPRQSDWSMDDYAEACLDAMRVAAAIARTELVNVAGFCAGGMTTSAVLSHLAVGQESLVNAATLGVTMIDSEVHGTLNMFASEKTVRSAVQRSRKKGILEGESLAKMFAFVRPNDLIWNYWVSNYLLGQNPPAFDVLAWNKDTTNLPASLHEQFMHMWIDNALMKRGTAQVLGTPVDLSRVDIDLYVAGALTDHLVPWQAAYAATQTFGGKVRFVLSNSGHIQALINPPGNPRSKYYTNDDYPADSAAWLEGAAPQRGTWWEDWAEWTLARSGDRRPKPRSLGNRRYPRIEDAPGRYVKE